MNNFYIYCLSKKDRIPLFSFWLIFLFLKFKLIRNLYFKYKLFSKIAILYEKECFKEYFCNIILKKSNFYKNMENNKIHYFFNGNW